MKRNNNPASNATQAHPKDAPPTSGSSASTSSAAARAQDAPTVMNDHNNARSQHNAVPPSDGQDGELLTFMVVCAGVTGALLGAEVIAKALF